MLTVATLDDTVIEEAGTVTALVLGDRNNPPVYLSGAANATTVTVGDNDIAAFEVSASSQEVRVGGTVRISIRTVDVTFADEQALSMTLAGTATAGEDFSAANRNGQELPSPDGITLPAGANSVSVPIRVATDAEEDDGETIEVSVFHQRRAVGHVTITITESAQPPVLIGGGGGGGGPSGPTPSAEDFEWTVTRDIEELDGGNDWPTGLWSDGRTLFIAENGQGADDEVYAYDLASGARVEEREFALHETNRAPRGFWSDRETVWVSDSGQERLFAYDLATGEGIEAREFELARRNRDARGI